MAVRKVIQIGHPALKAANKPVKSVDSPKTKRLIRDLADTLRKNELIGIAAQQIAENYTLFVTEARNTSFRKLAIEDKFRVYINPQIVSVSFDESIIYEGCGSVLNGQLFGPVVRPKEIIIHATDEYGKRFQLTCDGILSRVIQHEYDHLSGVEFLEKVNDYKRMMTDTYYVKNIKSSKEQVENSRISKIEYIEFNKTDS